MGVDQQKTLLKIRTFAEDLKRAQGVQGEQPASETEEKKKPAKGAAAFETPKMAAPNKTRHTVTIERRDKKELPKKEFHETPTKEASKPEPEHIKVQEPVKHLGSNIPAFHELNKKAHRDISVTTTQKPHNDKKKRNRSFSTTTTVITDNRRVGDSFFTRLSHSLSEWFNSIKDGFKAKQTPKYTVEDSGLRKGVIQKATTKTGAIFTADNETLREEIRRRQIKEHKNDEIDVNWSPNTEPGYALLEAPEGAESARIKNVQVTFKKKAAPEKAVTEKPVEEKEEKVTIPPATIITPSQPVDIAPEPIPEPEPVIVPEAPKPAPEPQPIPEPIEEEVEETPLQPEPVTEPSRIQLTEEGTSFISNKERFAQTNTNLISVAIVGGIFAVLILFIVGRALYSFMTADNTTVIIAAEPILPKTELVEMVVPELSASALRQTMMQSDAAATSNLAEVAIYTETKSVTPNEIIATLDLSTNPNLNQSVTTLHFVTIDKTKHGVLLEVNDAITALGALLAWEDSMAEELSQLLSLPASADASFIDRTIYDTDVRVLTNGGTEILVYGFVASDVILITTDSSAFERVIVEQF